MRYHALACDYDGTLAWHGRVGDDVCAALERVKHSGRRVILVTGRMLSDLEAVFPHLELFDRVVAENGAVLLRPASGEIERLAPPPELRFVDALRARGVAPLAVGDCIVATWEPHQDAVLDAIKELGVELQVIFNKGAVMVLPSSLNKAAGLTAALRELGLSPRNAVGVGDAENDHAFLALCECAVAVRNAVPALQERADWVTPADHGAGVIELAERLLADDLAELEWRLHRHDVELGTTVKGAPVPLPAYGKSLLVAGTSGGGKSTFAAGLIERLVERGAQVVVVDPEGDYAELPGAGVLGSAERPPEVEEVLRLAEQQVDGQLVVNLLGMKLEARPDCFAELLTRLLALRARTGRPHWLFVDEAHHLMPRERRAGAQVVPAAIPNAVWITVHPDHVAPALLEGVESFVALGKNPVDTLEHVAGALGVAAPPVPGGALEPGEAVLWISDRPPLRIHTLPPHAERRRHVRKYAEGTLSEERSFWFRGPEQKLRLRAPNLNQFLALADGVDDETWLHHLRRGDYSRWFREAIKDDELADEVEAIERDRASNSDSRKALRRAVETRYTLPE